MGESKHTPPLDEVHSRLVQRADDHRHEHEHLATMTTGRGLRRRIAHHQRAESDFRTAAAIVHAYPLMLEALRKWDDFGLKMWGREFTPETVKEFSELWSATSGAIKAATGGEHSHPIVDPTGAIVQPDGCTGGEPRQRHDWTLRAHADRWECVHGCGTPGPYKTMTPPDAPCSGRGATGGEP